MSNQALDNRRVSAILKEVALLLELKGENPFRVKAYSNAARTIEILEEDLRVMVREGRLKELKGIGEALAQHISELVATGSHGTQCSSLSIGHRLEIMQIC